MIPFLVIAGVAGLTLLSTGCEISIPLRETFPKNPPPEDDLAHVPCQVKAEPVLSFDAPSLEKNQLEAKKSQLVADLRAMRKINPRFLCGLEEIAVVEHKGFLKKPTENSKLAVEVDNEVLAYGTSPILDLLFGGKSVDDCSGFYDSYSRKITLSLDDYSRYVLFHEIGHHVHNLGILAATAQQFTSIGWVQDSENNLWARKGKPEDTKIFLRPYAAKDPKEDFADTFGFATAYPVVAGMRFFIQGAAEKNTPLHKKLDTLYRALDSFPPIQPVELQVADPFRLDFDPLPKTDGSYLYLYHDQKELWSRFNLVEMKWEGETKDVPNGILLDELLAKYKIQDDRIFIPEPLVIGGELAYFHNTKDGVELKSVHQDGKTLQLGRWKIPSEFSERMILPIEDGFLLVATAMRKDGKDGVVALTTFYLSKNSEKVREGETLNFPGLPDGKDPIRLTLPVRWGDLILFPSEDLTFFLAYRLSTDKFFLLEPTQMPSGAKIKKLHQLFGYREKLVALGVNQDGEYILAPLELKF